MPRYQSRTQKNTWQIQEAKAKFSQVVEEATKKGYQVITKNGVPVVVMLSKEEFDKMSKPRTSLLDFFRAAPCQDVDLDIQRSKDLPRELDL